MSFMPNPGTIVEMLDGRIAIVSGATPTGEGDKVLFEDGHQEPTDAWQFRRVLTPYGDGDDGDEKAWGAGYSDERPETLLAMLREYLTTSPKTKP